MPKLSLGTWAFTFGPFARQPWPLEKVLKYTAEAGYDGVELNGFRPHPHQDDYNTPAKRKDLMALIGDFGLGVSGYAPDFTQVPPAVVEPEAYLKIFRKCLAFCSGCGIKTLRVDTVSPPFALLAVEYEARFHRLASTWRAVGEEASREGILVVWEFEPGFWLNKPSEVKRLAEEVVDRHFKLLFDTSHAFMGSVIGARHTGELLPSLPWCCVDYCFCADVEREARRGPEFLRGIMGGGAG